MSAFNSCSCTTRADGRLPGPPWENRSIVKPRLWSALAAYAALALLAALTLDKVFRTLVLLVLAALAVKTWIAMKRVSES